jgi:hypothetical protein
MVLENDQKLNMVSSAAALTNKAGWFYEVKTNILYIKTAGNNSSSIKLNIK